MKTLTEQVLEILQDTKRSTLILSEVIRLDEFETLLKIAVREWNAYVIGEDETCQHERGTFESLEHNAINYRLEEVRKRAEETL